MNVYNMIRGEGRWQAIDQNTWGMILGKSGRLPGKLDPEIIALAKEKGMEFSDADPQQFYPDALDEFRKEMDQNGWEYGPDDEELFELAMHVCHAAPHGRSRVSGTFPVRNNSNRRTLNHRQ